MPGALSSFAFYCAQFAGVGGMTETVAPVVYPIRSVGLFSVPLDASMPAARIS